MITDVDIAKLKKVFVTKDDFYEMRTKISNVEEIVTKILTNLDGFIGRFDRLEMEYVALKIDDDRQNNHIAKIARHTGVPLKNRE